MLDFKMSLVTQSNHIEYCSICRAGVDKFVSVAPFDSICLDCATAIQELMNSANEEKEAKEKEVETDEPEKKVKKGGK